MNTDTSDARKHLGNRPAAESVPSPKRSSYKVESACAKVGPLGRDPVIDVCRSFPTVEPDGRRQISATGTTKLDPAKKISAIPAWHIRRSANGIEKDSG